MRHSHLQHRLTLLAKADAVANVSYYFRRRKFEEPPYLGMAYAQFDLEVVVDIMRQLRLNLAATIQYWRRDQAALLHMLKNLEIYKLQQRLDKRSEEEAVWEARRYYPIGGAFAWKRNPFVPELQDRGKQCAECGSPGTDTSWHRDWHAQHSAAVVCDQYDRQRQGNRAAEEENPGQENGESDLPDEELEDGVIPDTGDDAFEDIAGDTAIRDSPAVLRSTRQQDKRLLDLLEDQAQDPCSQAAEDFGGRGN